jgi:hypothetical protein
MIYFNSELNRVWRPYFLYLETDVFQLMKENTIYKYSNGVLYSNHKNTHEKGALERKYMFDFKALLVDFIAIRSRVLHSVCA